MSYNLRTGLTGSAGLDINVNLQNLDASNIPNLDTTKITTGQFPDARISDVSAAKVTGQLDPDTQVDFVNKDIILGTGDFACTDMVATTLGVTTKVVTPEIDTTGGNTNVTMRCPLNLNGNTIQNCPSLTEIHTNAIGYAATGTVVNNEHFYRIPAARFVSSDDRCPLVSDYSSGGLKLSGTPSTSTRLVATFQVPEGWFLASIRRTGNPETRAWCTRDCDSRWRLRTGDFFSKVGVAHVPECTHQEAAAGAATAAAGDTGAVETDPHRGQ